MLRLVDFVALVQLDTIAECLEAPPPEFFPEEGRTTRCWLSEPVGMSGATAPAERRVATGAA